MEILAYEHLSKSMRHLVYLFTSSFRKPVEWLQLAEDGLVTLFKDKHLLSSRISRDLCPNSLVTPKSSVLEHASIGPSDFPSLPPEALPSNCSSVHFEAIRCTLSSRELCEDFLTRANSIALPSQGG